MTAGGSPPRSARRRASCITTSAPKTTGRPWSTPPVEACGVAGVCRGWLLEQGLVEVAELTPRQVESADTLALCNAVRGILPVASLAEYEWPLHEAVAGLQAHLADAFPMFQVTQEVA